VCTRMACAASNAGPEAPADASATVAAEPHKVRSHPTEPRVGVGIVILRQLTQQKADAEVLLIRRAKDPCKGEQEASAVACFCGQDRFEQTGQHGVLWRFP
jgi:hypothetical protein